MASQRTENIFGYKPEELIGKPLDVLVPGRSRAAHGGRMHGYLHDPKAREMAAGLGCMHGARRAASSLPRSASAPIVVPWACS